MKYRYIFIIISLILVNSSALVAQSSRSSHFDIDKFKQEKAQFIIKEVELTDSEAKAFIPLANELMDKRFKLNRAARKEANELRERKSRSNADYEKLLESGYDIRAKELELDREYYQKFKKILSPEKIYKYQRAENRFMKKMVGNNRRSGGSK